MLWRGEIAKSGGFTDAGRNYLCALATVGYRDVFPYYAAVNWGDEDLREGGPYGLIGANYAGRDLTKIDQSVVVVHQFPTEVHRFVIEGKRNIVLTAWETDRLSSDGKFILDTLADEIWVPSWQNKEALKTSGVAKPIHVVPHCHGPWPVPDVKRPYWARDRYVFCYIGADNERKNPQAVLRAFIQEFGPDEPVALIYKVWIDVVWRKTDQTAAIVPVPERVRAALRDAGKPRCSPIAAMWGAPPTRDILKLHAWSDCFVSAHRGEAWGLAMSQAKMFGRKVIATGWGGPADFLDPDVDDLLPYTMVPVDPTSFGYRPGFTMDQSWAQVDEDALRTSMRLAFETRAVGSAVGMERFSWETVGKMMVERLTA